jgi:hypothetical protein
MHFKKKKAYSALLGPDSEGTRMEATLTCPSVTVRERCAPRRLGGWVGVGELATTPTTAFPGPVVGPARGITVPPTTPSLSTRRLSLPPRRCRPLGLALDEPAPALSGCPALVLALASGLPMLGEPTEALNNRVVLGRDSDDPARPWCGTTRPLP